MVKKKNQDELQDHVSGQANKPLSRPAHALAYISVIEEIQADAENGLSSVEAKSRLEEYGPNEFGDTGGVQPAKILLRQVANAMTLVMLPPTWIQCARTDPTTGSHPCYGGQLWHWVLY